MPLSPENQRHLIAAQGYVEMGMFLDANEELEEIDAHVTHLPEVLAIGVLIYQGLQQWEVMQGVAKKLAKHEPDNDQCWMLWTYATRRAESLEAARTVLLKALEVLSEQAMIHYDIACYECQLKNLVSATRYLQEAFKYNSALRMAALEDEDLEELWGGLKSEVW